MGEFYDMAASMVNEKDWVDIEIIKETESGDLDFSTGDYENIQISTSPAKAIILEVLKDVQKEKSYNDMEPNMKMLVFSPESYILELGMFLKYENQEYFISSIREIKHKHETVISFVELKKRLQ